MQEKNLIVKKHSAFVQISVKNLTLIQRKMINSLMYLAQKENNCDKKIYHTTIHSLKEMCKIDSTENVDLKKQLKKLSQITIEFNYLNKDKREVWECMSLLASSKVIKDTNIIAFEFSWALLEKIINPLIYAPLNVRLISNLKSSYSIILYEFLRDYIDSPVIPQIKISDFKELMGIKEHEYKTFFNFKTRVLDVAVKEINSKMDIHCDYKLIKSFGNKYSHIQFKAKKKKISEASGIEIDTEAITIPEHSEIPGIKKPAEIIVPEIPSKKAAASFSKDDEKTINQNCYENLLKQFDSPAVRKIIAIAEKEHDQKYVENNIRYCVDFAIRKTEEGKMKGSFQGLLSKAMKENYGTDYIPKEKEKKSSLLDDFLAHEKKAVEWFQKFSYEEKKSEIKAAYEEIYCTPLKDIELKIQDNDWIIKAYNKFLKDKKKKSKD